MGLGCSSVVEHLISTHKAPELPLKRGMGVVCAICKQKGGVRGQEEPNGARVNILIHFCSTKEWKIQELKTF